MISEKKYLYSDFELSLYCDKYLEIYYFDFNTIYDKLLQHYKNIEDVYYDSGTIFNIVNDFNELQKYIKKCEDKTCAEYLQAQQVCNLLKQNNDTKSFQFTLKISQILLESMFLYNQTLENKLEAQVVEEIDESLKKVTFSNVYEYLLKAIAPLLVCRYEL